MLQPPSQAVSTWVCRSARVQAKVVNTQVPEESKAPVASWKALTQVGLALGGVRIGLDRYAEHLGSHCVAAQVAGAAIRGGVTQADALDAARIVGRKLLALDRHRQFRMAVLLRQALRTEPEFLAEAAPFRGHVGKVDQGLRRTEGGFDTELLLGQDAHGEQFHDRGRRWRRR
jgi:hypothetical protein